MPRRSRPAGSSVSPSSDFIHDRQCDDRGGIPPCNHIESALLERVVSWLRNCGGVTIGGSDAGVRGFGLGGFGMMLNLWPEDATDEIAVAVRVGWK